MPRYVNPCRVLSFPYSARKKFTLRWSVQKARYSFIYEAAVSVASCAQEGACPATVATEKDEADRSRKGAPPFTCLTRFKGTLSKICRPDGPLPRGAGPNLQDQRSIFRTRCDGLRVQVESITFRKWKLCRNGVGSIKPITLDLWTVLCLQL